MVAKVKMPHAGKVVCVYEDGETFPFFLHLMPAQDLKDLKRVLLKKIHNLCIDRADLYDQLASVNGELDRRVNEAARSVKVEMKMEMRQE